MIERVPCKTACPRLSYSTLACPDWSWEEIVARGVEYGFDGVEVRQVAGETDLRQAAAFGPSRRAHLRTELESRGFAICGLSSSVRFDYATASERAAQTQIGREYVDLAAEVGAEFVRVFGDVLPADESRHAAVIAQIADGLNALGEHAAASGVDVLLETHGDFARSSRVVELFAEVHSPAVGVLWDTHHPWRFFQEPLGKTYNALEPWVRHTHWKDSIGPGEVQGVVSSEHSQAAANRAHALMSGHKPARYVLFGEGEFPAVECARLLEQSGYARLLSLEWEKMWHPEIAEPEVALPAFVRTIRDVWACT